MTTFETKPASKTVHIGLRILLGILVIIALGVALSYFKIISFL